MVRDSRSGISGRCLTPRRPRWQSHWEIIWPVFILHTSSQNSDHVMVATNDFEISAAMKQLNKDTDICPVITLQLQDITDPKEPGLYLMVASFVGTVAVFKITRNNKRLRVPRGLMTLCTQVIVLGWEVEHSMKLFGIKEVKAAVDSKPVDKMCLNHDRFPYAAPRGLPYDYYLVSQLMYGHHVWRSYQGAIP